jgi:hypothetical protein
LTEKPILVEAFYHDGRGPSLKRAHWGGNGQILVAIDYFNHDAASEVDQRHVVFGGIQVVMITPEEVIDYTTLGSRLVSHRPAAAFDLGRSEWLNSFSDRHLAKCHHFQLVFYDDLFDIICESVEAREGAYIERVERPGQLLTAWSGRRLDAGRLVRKPRTLDEWYQLPAS